MTGYQITHWMINTDDSAKPSKNALAKSIKVTIDGKKDRVFKIAGVKWRLNHWEYTNALGVAVRPVPLDLAFGRQMAITVPHPSGNVRYEYSY